MYNYHEELRLQRLRDRSKNARKIVEALPGFKKGFGRFVYTTPEYIMYPQLFVRTNRYQNNKDSW